MVMTRFSNFTYTSQSRSINDHDPWMSKTKAHTTCISLCRKLFDFGLELLHIPTDYTVLQGLAILEQDKSRHGVHLQVPRDRRHLVDIDLNESDVCVGLAELSNDGGNGFARTAPSSEKIDNNGSGRGESFVDDGA